MARAGVLLALAEAADAVARAARAVAKEEEATTASADELFPIAKVALEARGFELKPVARAAESGELRSVKIGRSRYTKTSWILAWAEGLPVAPVSTSTSEPVDEIAEAARKRAARRAAS
jgi:hypothetical protein